MIIQRKTICHKCECLMTVFAPDKLSDVGMSVISVCDKCKATTPEQLDKPARGIGATKRISL